MVITYAAWSDALSEWNSMFSPPDPSNFLANSTVKSRLDGRFGNDPPRATLPVFRSKENVHGTWFTVAGPAWPPKLTKHAAGAPVDPAGCPWRVPRLPEGVNGVQSPRARNAS